MFALLRSKRMQLRNMQAHKQCSVPSVKKAMRYIYTVLNLECVEVHENEMQLRKSSGGTAQSRSCAP